MRVTASLSVRSYAWSMDEEPLVSVVRGEPSPEEVTALVVALLGGTGPEAPAPAATPWTLSGRPAARNAGWRVSALPR